MARELLLAVIYILALLFALWLIMADVRNQKSGKYYDCTLASFHPDIPPAAKEACRRRSEYEQDGAAIAEQQRYQNHKK